jgi:hypothetical protein
MTQKDINALHVKNNLTPDQIRNTPEQPQPNAYIQKMRKS